MKIAIEETGAALCPCKICVLENVTLELLRIKASDNEPITYHRAREIVAELVNGPQTDLVERIRNAVDATVALAPNWEASKRSRPQ